MKAEGLLALDRDLPSNPSLCLSNKEWKEQMSTYSCSLGETKRKPTKKK